MYVIRSSVSANLKAIKVTVIQSPRSIGKREFVQHISKYIQWVEDSDSVLIITHHKHPELALCKIKPKQFQDLHGTTEIIIHGDVNEAVLPGYYQWLS